MYIHIIIIHKSRRCEFEKEQGAVYRRTWREERKGRNGIIISKLEEVLKRSSQIPFYKIYKS